MNGLLALSIVCILYAIGDYFANKTKALFSMIFVTSVLFLIAFWLGLPKTVFADAKLIDMGNLLVALLITHMGTLMGIKDLLKQWKTVIVAVVAVIGIVVALYFIGIPLVGREFAISAAPPISGGFVATLIMSEAAKAQGLDQLVVFVTLILVLQSFFGYPLASLFLKKEAKRLLNGLKEKTPINPVTANETAATASPTQNTKSKFQVIPALPKDLQTSFILLAKLSIAAFIAVELANLFDNVIHKFVWALIIGIIGRETGFLEENIMVKSNAFGLGMLALLSVVFVNLAQATPQMLLSLLWPILATLTIAVIGIGVFTIIMSKLLGYSKEMSFSIGLSALFGFPGTFILPNEVANAVGETEEEKKAILNEILPKMIVAGFMTVTISSVIIAGILAKWL